MVCLYGVTLRTLKNNLTLDEINQYPLWNWLIHKLTYFIYTKYENLYQSPSIPGAYANNPYSQWFDRVYKALEEMGFYDVNADRVMWCLENPPSEDIADEIYNAVPLSMQIEFMEYLNNDHCEKQEEGEKNYFYNNNIKYLNPAAPPDNNSVNEGGDCPYDSWADQYFDEEGL